MQFYRFIASLEHILFRTEYQHLVSLGCPFPSINLCELTREYVSLYGSLPDLNQLVMYQYVPCLDECEYGLCINEAVPVLVHSIKTYGIFLPCKIMYLFHIHHAFSGEYPPLEEFLSEHVGQDMSGLQNQLMSQQVDEFWQNQSSGLARNHFPSRTLNEPLHENCAICQEKMDTGQQVITLPCMHTFHTKQDGCSGIEEWYTKINSCPLCKTKLS